MLERPVFGHRDGIASHFEVAMLVIRIDHDDRHSRITLDVPDLSPAALAVQPQHAVRELVPHHARMGSTILEQRDKHGGQRTLQKIQV